MEKYKDPNDIVNLDDICAHLQKNFSEFQRRNPSEIMKTVKWQVDHII